MVVGARGLRCDRRREEPVVNEIEKRIQAIEDRTAIVELTGRYCHMARTGNVEGIVDLFCEDGVMETGGVPEKGRERLLAMYGEAFSIMHPMPCVHNHTVTLEGDRAKGCCSVEIRMVIEGEAITAAGDYEDTFRRVGSSWKFEHRNLTLYHQVPHLKGWA
jgi:ketosteroid isomerase-like protein